METEVIAEVQQATFWNQLVWSGTMTVTLFLAAAALLIAGVLIYLFFKSKRPFGIWVLTTCIKFSLLSAGFVLLRGLVLICHTTHPPWPADLLISMLIDALNGPRYLMGLALIAFVIKSIFRIREKICQPEHGAYAEIAG